MFENFFFATVGINAINCYDYLFFVWAEVNKQKGIYIYIYIILLYYATKWDASKTFYYY